MKFKVGDKVKFIDATRGMIFYNDHLLIRSLDEIMNDIYEIEEVHGHLITISSEVFRIEDDRIYDEYYFELVRTKKKIG